MTLVPSEEFIELSKRCIYRGYQEKHGEDTDWGGVETQIAAGERLAKGLALRGKVRSSGRFGKHTSSDVRACTRTSAIPQQLFRGNYSCKLQEEVKYLVKWGNNQAKEKSLKCSLL